MSTRLPQFLNLTTSKTRQFCETSSILEVDNVKNETILRDILQKWKVECRADDLVPMRFAIFHSICLKCCACHVLEMPQNPHVLLTFDKVHNPLRLPRETTSERPKVLRTPQFFTLLTSKCALYHNGVHFFDISTSKSGPDLACFVHFDFETRRFSEPTFRPSGATNHWKNIMFRDFPTFSRAWIFFLRRLSLFDLLSSSLPTSAFHLSILSES